MLDYSTTASWSLREEETMLEGIFYTTASRGAGQNMAGLSRGNRNIDSRSLKYLENSLETFRLTIPNGYSGLGDI